MKEIRTSELFAGVGGFRVGLERASSKFKVVWSNQWEPSTKSQAASDIYVKNFGDINHSNKNISTVNIEEIPDHDLLVGGFPCQDYSVARTLSQSAGLQGKKGVLWWDIHRILKEKENPPKFLFLENVDRLIKSPVKQRGRDFAIMLASLNDLGYAVEWRIINAADYGMPQRRRRIFILGYLKGTKIYKKFTSKNTSSEDWIMESGIFAETFEVQKHLNKSSRNFTLEGDLENLTRNFNTNNGKAISPFLNAGVCINRQVTSIEVKSNYDGTSITLGDIILPDEDIPSQYFINEKDIDKWNYFKGAKNEQRTNKTNGFVYNYTEGAMVFPDPLNMPSRTIITGEGGAAPSRFKHVIKTKSGKLRRLTPVELERLNMFPDNHTEGASDIKRAFFMGNALVVGIIEKVGKILSERL